MWEELVCLLLILYSVHVCRHIHMCVDACTGICAPVCAACGGQRLTSSVFSLSVLCSLRVCC